MHRLGLLCWLLKRLQQIGILTPPMLSVCLPPVFIFHPIHFKVRPQCCKLATLLKGDEAWYTSLFYKTPSLSKCDVFLITQMKHTCQCVILLKGKMNTLHKKDGPEMALSGSSAVVTSVNLYSLPCVL